MNRIVVRIEETSMNLPPRRRWFRFSLRALFLVVTAFGCWLGYQLNWIRQREEFLASGRGSESIYVISHQPIRAPRVLSLLGEARKGVDRGQRLQGCRRSAAAFS